VYRDDKVSDGTPDLSAARGGKGEAACGGTNTVGVINDESVWTSRKGALRIVTRYVQYSRGRKGGLWKISRNKIRVDRAKLKGEKVHLLRSVTKRG